MVGTSRPLTAVLCSVFLFGPRDGRIMAGILLYQNVGREARGGRCVVVKIPQTRLPLLSGGPVMMTGPQPGISMMASGIILSQPGEVGSACYMWTGTRLVLRIVAETSILLDLNLCSVVAIIQAMPEILLKLGGNPMCGSMIFVFIVHHSRQKTWVQFTTTEKGTSMTRLP